MEGRLPRILLCVLVIFVIGGIAENSDINAKSGLVVLCPGVEADPTGATDASGALQICINSHYGSILDLPAGVYGIAKGLTVNRPITIRTANAAGHPSCASPGFACATFWAKPELYNINGGVIVLTGNNIALDHIIIDGNRLERLQTQAASDCLPSSMLHNRMAGFNGYATCNNCSFTSSVSRNALCGSGFFWQGTGNLFSNSAFITNGDATSGRVADGLTMAIGTNVLVESCLFQDNTDINFIIGSGVNGRVITSTISMTPSYGWAAGGFMMDNFGGATDGNFNGFVFSGNTIECGAELCHYAIEVGGHPWYHSSNVFGGTITKNLVNGGGVNINVYGGGTAASPVSIYGNTLKPVATQWKSTCGIMPGSLFNIANDSVVYRNGETDAVTRWNYPCP